MPGAIHTTKPEVLKRVRNLLRARLQSLSDSVYVVATDEIPQTKARTAITVQMTGGSFDYKAIMGASRRVVPYQGSVQASVWSLNSSDQNGVDEQALLNDENGLFILEMKIINALTGSYLDESETGGSGILLTSPMYPMNDSTPEKMNQEQTGTRFHGANARATMAVVFGIEFNLLLS